MRSRRRKGFLIKINKNKLRKAGYAEGKTDSFFCPLRLSFAGRMTDNGRMTVFENYYAGDADEKIKRIKIEISSFCIFY